VVAQVTKRRLLRVISADWDEIAMDCYDNDPVQVWILLPQVAGRRAFLTQGSKLITSQGKDVTSENAMALVGERFWVTLEEDPPWEESLAERIPFLTVEHAPFMDDLRILGLRKP
jgi:hypothetical protein